MRVPFAPLAIALALIPVASVLAACSQRDNFIVVPETDVAASAAQVEARKTLPVFWSKFDGKAPGLSEFRLKVGLPTPNGAVEHIWTDLVSRSGDEIVGRIANDPVNLPKLKLGSEVRIDPETISDWGYVKDEKLYGAYTMRALMDRMPENKQAEARAFLSPEPLEAGAN